MRRIPLLVTLAMIASISPVSARAEPGSDEASRYPAAAGAHARLEAARLALEGGGLADAVAVAAELGGHPLPPGAPGSLPAASGPGGADLADAGPLGAVAPLSAAVTLASEASERAILDAPAARRIASTIFRDLDLARMPQARGAEMPHIPDARFVPPSAGDDARARLLRLLPRLDEIVDLGLMYSAAARVAATIDAVLPALRRQAVTRSTGTSAAPCDLHRSDEVCVSSEAANTYSAADDFSLLVDLGGDDVYRNAAGGCLAPALVPSGNGYASILLDVAGNDRYEAVATGPIGLVSGPPVQGSCFGGIGMLVDARGDDSYLATNTAPGTKVHAQGMALIGVGLLADLAGSDTYRADDPTVEIYPGDDWATAGAGGLGQGLIGMGIAIDQGQGDDRSTIVSTPQEALVDPQGWLQPAHVGSGGFGQGALGGIGIHYDGGGSDVQLVESRSVPVAPDDPRPLKAPWATIGAWANSIFGGVGIQVGGDGPTDRIGRAKSSAPVVQLTTPYAMASGGFGAYSGLYDAGGDDRYVVEALAHARSSGTLDDACECSGEAVHAIASPFWSEMVTHAAGGLVSGDTGNVLLLHDAGGDDEYVATIESVAVVEAHDARTQFPPPPKDDPEAVVGLDGIAWAGVSASRSLGTGFSNGAYAALEDDGGRDVYHSAAHNEVHVRVTADRDEAEPEGFAQSDGVRGFSQGYGSNGGFGLLRDAGGGDVYRSSLTEVATARPETSLTTGDLFNWVQGAGDIAGFGMLLDLEGGAADTFSAQPALEICSGTYGEAWVFCGTGGGGAGFNL